MAMKKSKSIWSTLASILKAKGPGHFSDFLMNEAIERGNKLEKLARIVEKYKASIDLGEEIHFVREGMFGILSELNK